MTSEFITRAILATCKDIVKHVKRSTGDCVDIHQMTLFFKIDQNFKIWLQFCTGLKIKNDIMNEKVNRCIKMNEEIILRVVEKIEEESEEQVKHEVAIDTTPSPSYNMNPKQKICSVCHSNFMLSRIQHRDVHH